MKAHFVQYFCQHFRVTLAHLAWCEAVCRCVPLGQDLMIRKQWLCKCCLGSDPAEERAIRHRIIPPLKCHPRPKPLCCPARLFLSSCVTSGSPPLLFLPLSSGATWRECVQALCWHAANAESPVWPTHAGESSPELAAASGALVTCPGALEARSHDPEPTVPLLPGLHPSFLPPAPHCCSPMPALYASKHPPPSLILGGPHPVGCRCPGKPSVSCDSSPERAVGPANTQHCSQSL